MGRTSPPQLRDRRWRFVISWHTSEGLAVLRAAGIRPAPVEGVPPRPIAFALRLPDALFRLAARRMLDVDRNARSSMWEDLQAGRPTEIDYLQGEIVRLAEKHGVEAPRSHRVLQRVKEAEKAGKGSSALPPEALEGAQRGRNRKAHRQLSSRGPLGYKPLEFRRGAALGAAPDLAGPLSGPLIISDLGGLHG